MNQTEPTSEGWRLTESLVNTGKLTPRVLTTDFKTPEWFKRHASQWEPKTRAHRVNRAKSKAARKARKRNRKR